MGRVHFVLTGFVNADADGPPTWASRAPYPDHRSALLAARMRIAKGQEVRVDISQVDDLDSRIVTTVTGDGMTFVAPVHPPVSDEIDQVMAAPYGTTVNVGDTVVERRWRSTSISTLVAAPTLGTRVKNGTQDLTKNIWRSPWSVSSPGPFRVLRGSRISAHKGEAGVLAIGRISPTANGSTLQLRYRPTGLAWLLFVGGTGFIVMSLVLIGKDLIAWLRGYGLEDSSSESETLMFDVIRLIMALLAGALAWWTVRQVRKYRREIDREIITSCAERRAT